jgi:hypothetical protein
MQTRNLAALLCTLVCTLGYCLGTASSALAETIVVDDQVQVRDSQSDKPKRGVTMTQVEAKFGAPVTKHDAVGAPPITRWDYPGFSVFFEHEWVIDTVTTSG